MSLLNPTTLSQVAQNAHMYGGNQMVIPPVIASALHAAGVTISQLSDRDLSNKVETDLLYWRVVALVASRAVTAPVKIDSLSRTPSTEDIEVMTTLLRQWKGAFFIAQASAEAYGEAFLLVNTFREDGAATSQTTIKPHSVARVTVVPCAEYLKREGDYYYYPKQPQSRGSRRIHKSRVLHFVGRHKAGVAPAEGVLRYKSHIRMFDYAYQLYNAALGIMLGTMAQKTTTIITKKGLDADVAMADDPESYVKDTLTALTRSLTENGIALLDGRFDVTMLAKSMSGFDTAIADLRRNLVAHSGLTDSLLFNDTTKAHAVAGSEDPDEQFLAGAVDYLMDTAWCPMMTHLFGFLKGAPELVVRMQSSYKLSATAMAKIRLDLLRGDAIAIQNQIIIPGEARSREIGDFTTFMTMDLDYVPPKVPIKLKETQRRATLNNANVTPRNRGVVDPTAEGQGTDNPKSIADEDDWVRMSDEELGEFLVGFGKSQPRLGTLKVVEERAIADGDCPTERVGGFCEFWRDGDGESMCDADMDLIPDRKQPVEVQVQDGLFWYWFSGRRTPILAGSVAAARKKLRRGGPGLVKSRAAKPSEYAGGKWFRGGANGEAPGKSKLRGFGPKPKNYKG